MAGSRCGKGLLSEHQILKLTIIENLFMGPTPRLAMASVLSFTGGLCESPQDET